MTHQTEFHSHNSATSAAGMLLSLEMRGDGLPKGRR